MTHPIAMITGATSRIGAEFAHQLAQQGYGLILTGRRADKLQALAAELSKSFSVPTEVLTGDLATTEGLAAHEAKIASTPDLALLVNNAGFGVVGYFAETSLQAQMGMVQVHIVATTRLTHAALRGMLARKSGAIINTSSVAAFLPYGGRSVIYGSTKAYINMFCETLHDELRGTGVRIQALCPGFTYTEFHDRPGFENFKRSNYPRFAWLSAEYVVRESLKALKRDQVICVPSLIYQLITGLARNPLVTLVIRSFSGKK